MLGMDPFSRPGHRSIGFCDGYWHAAGRVVAGLVFGALVALSQPAAAAPASKHVSKATPKDAPKDASKDTSKDSSTDASKDSAKAAAQPQLDREGANRK